MKTFPLRLSDEQHKEIRSKAFKAEKSMHAYILDCIERRHKTYFGNPNITPKEQPNKEMKITLKDLCPNEDKDCIAGTDICKCQPKEPTKKARAEAFKKVYGYPKEKSLNKKK